jgi:hypothetical protein
MYVRFLLQLVNYRSYFGTSLIRCIDLKGLNCHMHRHLRLDLSSTSICMAIFMGGTNL